MQGAVLEAVHQAQRVAPPRLLPRELGSASQRRGPTALNCVCEHLSFSSVYFVHSLVRCLAVWEKPKRARKDVMLSVKLDVIKRFDQEEQNALCVC